MKQNQKKEVCAYIRVSSHGQEEYSPDAQLRLIQEYADAHDMIITGVYQDLGISGRKVENRKEFVNMIAECRDKSHPYDAILVWKFSRFARNQDESIVYKSLLKKENVDVISVSEPIPDGFAGGLIERILEWMDEYYSIRLSGEVRRGMTQKALQGGYNAIVPVGYTKVPGAHTIPEIDNKYADMVRSVYHMYADEQRSLLYIARQLNSSGYRTRRGNEWESRNISEMIQNPFYIGKVRWNNTNRRGHTKEIVGETIIADGKHEPLISTELWEAANKRLQEVSSRYNHCSRTTNVRGNVRHWLSGILKCPYCGATLAYSNVHGYISFRCTKRVKGSCTDNPPATIRLERAENDVLEGLRNIIANRKIEKLPPIPSVESTSIIESISNRIDELTRRTDRLRESYLAGIDTLEEYKDKRSQLKKELEQLNNKLAELDLSPAAAPVPLSQFENTYEYLSSPGDDPETMSKKAEAIRSIVDYIVYHKDTDTMEFFLVGE